ncbi:MAG: hypothetical protein JNM80_10410 [Phycisphaerae bacterium]|nr:hypothetical protein [Phycisphaerae bacterium]
MTLAARIDRLTKLQAPALEAARLARLDAVILSDPVIVAHAKVLKAVKDANPKSPEWYGDDLHWYLHVWLQDERARPALRAAQTRAHWLRTGELKNFDQRFHGPPKGVSAEEVARGHGAALAEAEALAREAGDAA